MGIDEKTPRELLHEIISNMDWQMISWQININIDDSQSYQALTAYCLGFEKILSFLLQIDLAEMAKALIAMASAGYTAHPSVTISPISIAPITI